MQEKASDRAAELDAIKAKKVQEEHERQLKLKERQALEKK